MASRRDQQGETCRDWSDLPTDVLLAIFHRLDCRSPGFHRLRLPTLARRRAGRAVALTLDHHAGMEAMLNHYGMTPATA